MPRSSPVDSERNSVATAGSGTRGRRAGANQSRKPFLATGTVLNASCTYSNRTEQRPKHALPECPVQLAWASAGRVAAEEGQSPSSVHDRLVGHEPLLT